MMRTCTTVQSVKCMVYLKNGHGVSIAKSILGKSHKGEVTEVGRQAKLL